MEETEEADELFFHTVKAAAVAGLYQVFLEGGPGSGILLRRACARAAAPASNNRDILRLWEACLQEVPRCRNEWLMS